MYSTSQLITAMSNMIKETNAGKMKWEQDNLITNDKSLDFIVTYKSIYNGKAYYISKLNTKNSFDGEEFYNSIRFTLHIYKVMPHQDILIYEYHDEERILYSLYENAQNSIAASEDALGDFFN